MSAAPVLSIRDAKKSFGNVPALQGVTLDLYPGELLGFLGPNGAGKTTLIRSIAGRCKLDRGTIQCGDQGVRKDLLGVVPQSIALYADLTAAQNLRAFARLHGVGKRQVEDRVHDALRWSNLADRAHRFVKTFSGGMQRRLNIACGVLHQPRVLLLDEPTVGVDPQSRERIYGMLDELRRQGTAILLTTHQLDEAQFRCDRIAIVDNGRVVRTGSFNQLVGSTVGTDQRLRIRFRHPPAPLTAPFSMSSDGRTATCLISDFTREIPHVIEMLEGQSDAIEHFVLQQPTLQDVFLHLTGKELRE